MTTVVPDLGQTEGNITLWIALLSGDPVNNAASGIDRRKIQNYRGEKAIERIELFR